MTSEIAHRSYQSQIDGADWEISADDLVQIQLTLSLSRHIPNWPGATDDQLYAVAQEIVNVLDNTPQVSEE